MKQVSAPLTPRGRSALVESYRHEWLHNEQVFDPLVRYNLAHVAMLARQRIVPRPVAVKLLRGLKGLQAAGFAALPYDPALDGLQPNVEAELTRRLGAGVAGWLNTGRARQECELVARQIVERDGLLAIVARTLALREAVAALARREARAVMPYYTWAQQAEPITFGFYAAALAEALAADGERLQAAYRSINRARADCGQVVPPALPIDREFVARMLGFDGVMGNSLYAYSSLDAEMEALAALSILMGNLARFAENLFVWCSSEFGFMEFSETFSGTSYVMPQKKNPYALRQVRPTASRVAAAWSDVLGLFTGGLPMVGNGLIHAPNRVIGCIDPVKDTLGLLAQALPELRLRHARMKDAAADHWAQAPQLVYHLVNEHGIAFREAHHVIGQLVSNALSDGLTPRQVTAEMLEGAVRATLGRTLRVDAASLRKAMDPAHAVMTRTVGGPAPKAIASQLAGLRVRLRTDQRWLAIRTKRLESSTERLNAAVGSIRRVRSSGRSGSTR